MRQSGSKQEEGEWGILFFDLRSGVAEWKVPPSERIRVSGERLKALLLEGLDVQVGYSMLITLIVLQDQADMSVIMLVVQELRSRHKLLERRRHSPLRRHQHSNRRVRCRGRWIVLSIRSALLSYTPDLGSNKKLPTRLLGATVVYPSRLALKLSALDPFFFQDGDPQSSIFMYFSFLHTPSNNTRSDRPNTYELQIILSWPYRRGLMDRVEPLDVPPTRKEKVALMEIVAKGWAEPFQEMVMSIPEDADAKAVAVEDLLPKQRMWDNMGGRITLVGDAAHAMTMHTCQTRSVGGFPCDMGRCSLLF